MIGNRSIHFMFRGSAIKIAATSPARPDDHFKRMGLPSSPALGALTLYIDPLSLTNTGYTESVVLAVIRADASPYPHFQEEQPAESLKGDDAARIFAGLEIGEGLRRLVDVVAMRDQFLELEPSCHVQPEQARVVDPRDAGSEIAAGEGFFLERQAHGSHRRCIARLGEAHHHRHAAPCYCAKAERGEFAVAHALEGVVRTAARQLLDRLDQILSRLGK